MTFVSQWSVAFATTLLVELVVGTALLGAAGTRARRAGTVAFGQLLTHPAVWFIFPNLGLSRLPYLLLAESWAIGVELAFYRFVFTRLSWSRAFAVSALANAASYAFGVWSFPWLALRLK